MSTEITTAAERAAVQNSGTVLNLEPTLTLGQVERLLAAATEYARATQPLVVYQAASVVPSVNFTEGSVSLAGPSTRAAHPGIDVNIPSPPQTGYVAPYAPLRRPGPARRAWGLWLVYGSLAGLLCGASTAAFTDGNPAAVALIAAGIAGTVAGTAVAIADEDRREAGA